MDEEELRKYFWPYVKKEEGDDPCWRWSRGADSDGYGRATYKGKRMPAHRLSHMVHKGETPSHLLVRHTCNNRYCVNPDHLVLGTHADNAHDREERGRSNYTGTRSGKRLLTDGVPKFIKISEKGKVVFRFPETEDKPVDWMISEIMAMEVLRGHTKANKSDAIRNAVSFYHAALKRGLTHEQHDAIHPLPARSDEHSGFGDADQ